MNKEVKEFLDKSSNYKVIEYINQLQQENKQLKELNDFLKADNNNLYQDLQFIKDTGYETPQRLALEFISLRERNNKAINDLDKLNIKLKETLSTGINIKEISDIKEILKGDSNE